MRHGSTFLAIVTSSLINLIKSCRLRHCMGHSKYSPMADVVAYASSRNEIEELQNIITIHSRSKGISVGKIRW